jgi:hypothetical protein
VNITDLLPLPEQETLPRPNWLRIDNDEYVIARNCLSADDGRSFCVEIRWSPSKAINFSDGGSVFRDGYYLYSPTNPEFIPVYPSYEMPLLQYGIMAYQMMLNQDWSPVDVTDGDGTC